MLNIECLNGWWDFLPVETTTEIPAEIPATGWNPDSVLTPSWWTKSRFAVRRRGERHYRGLKATDAYHEDDEFLFDAYGYPLEWAQKRSGWLRREWVRGLGDTFGSSAGNELPEGLRQNDIVGHI
jgi:hypothetical protein